MSQEIKQIALKDLALWTENPRDPIDENVSDQDIADRAISSDRRSRWSLERLFQSMGPRFDQSEIPTVVYVNNSPVVYDGNRRVLIGKIIHKHVQAENADDLSDFDFPDVIPCNVCDEETALEHVDRKHAESGSWLPLERDIFKHTHMKEGKTPFLIIEEATKLISENKEMNQRFVKEEIFAPKELHEMGFSTNGGQLKHSYEKNKDANAVLNAVIELVKNKTITTRKNRGMIIELLNQINPELLAKAGKEFKPFEAVEGNKESSLKKTKITKGKQHKLFGKTLSLQKGSVNNIYSDLLSLYKEKDKKGYSEDFPMLIRMGLRLLVELAAEDADKELNLYLKGSFDEAKNKLNPDEKTTLSTEKIDKNSIVKLIQIGAHAYTASNNIKQTVALSLIIGKMLENSHGKEQK